MRAETTRLHRFGVGTVADVALRWPRAVCTLPTIRWRGGAGRSPRDEHDIWPARLCGL